MKGGNVFVRFLPIFVTSSFKISYMTKFLNWRVLFIAIPILLIFNDLLAQRGGGFSGEVSGRVLDGATEEAVAYATVSVIDADSEELVKGTVTEDNGNFFIDGVEQGTYFLRVNFIGYSAYNTDVFTLDRDNPNQFFRRIYMGSSAQELDEVVVSEQRSSFETRLDRRIFNVENDLVSEGGTTLDVLGNVPGIEVDIDDNISLRGDENVTILIDGRPSTFTSAEVLQQIPGNSIERIEVITNPSARFDPEGMAGIINIILKQDQNLGINGTVTGTYSRGKSDSYSGSFGVNMRNSNVNLYANYSYNNRDRISDGTGESRVNFPDTVYSFKQTDERLRNNVSHLVRGGADFFINSRNTLYASGNYRTNDRLNENILTIDYFDKIGDPTFESIRRTVGSGDGYGYEFNAGWQKQFLNPNNSMDLDLSYSLNTDGRGNDYFQDFYNIDGEEIQDPFIQTEERDNLNRVFSSRLDFELELWDGWEVETGARVDVTDIDNKLNSFDIDPSTGEMTNDKDISNHFLYDQSVFAGYFSIGSQTGNWQYKAGLRAEQTYTSSELRTTEESFENNYFSLFPSAFLSYSLSEGEDLILSYSRRVNRPSTWQLNPFRNQSDPNNFRTGNPFLQPEYTDVFELSHVKIWDQLTLNNSLYYRQTNDLIRRFITFDPEGITIVTFENIGRSHSYGVEAIANYRPYRWWNINATANVFGQHIEESDLTEGLNRSSSGYRLNLSSNKTVWNGMSVQVSGRYRSGFTVPQGEIDPFFNIDMAIRKNFLDNNLTISLNARDVFNTLSFNFKTVEDAPIVRTRERNWDSRVFTVNATYRFGRQLEGPERRRERRENGDRFSTPDIE